MYSLYNIKYMKIPELIDLINEFVFGKDLATEEKLNEKQKKSKASNIKRQYNMLIQNKKASGKKIQLRDLKKLMAPLLENYQEVSKYEPINETLQLMAEDIRESNMTTQKDKDNMENEIATIYASILGNPGTSTKGMTSEYISKIIAKKVADADDINRDDIMNLLIMQSQNMYLDIEQYQNLINASVICFLSTNKDSIKFTNPKVFKVFESLAASYKVQGDFEKVKEVYEKALRLKSLENTIEYQEIKEKYEDFIKYMDLKKNFDDKRFDSFEDLMDSLNVKFSDDGIFRPEKERKDFFDDNPQNLKQSRSNYVMPVSKKMEGFKRLVRSLKRDNPDYDILECEIGKDLYAGYVIFKIENANVSILENFNAVNARIFIVKNEQIDQVRKLARNEAIGLDGVEAANHIENFENYCRNLIRKTKTLIRQTQVGVAPPTEEELAFDDDSFIDSYADISSERVQVPNKKDGEEQEGENKEETGEQEEIDDKGDVEEKEELHDEISQDMIEEERRKAHKKREYVKELKARIERIQKEKEEKIAKVKNGKSEEK